MKTVLFLGAGLWTGILFAAVPTDLTADAVFRDRFTARWTNVGAVASNALEVVAVFPRELEADFVTNYTFDAVSNDKKSVIPLTREDFDRLEPGFGGEKIRVAANDTGHVQIGVSSGNSKEGCLEFDGLPSYEGLSLVLSARKMASNNSEAGMPIEYVTAGETNLLMTLSITNTMEHYAIPLDVVAGGARLLFHSSSYKSDPRVLIDSIGFARDYTLPYSRTNAVASAVFPARGVHRVRGLEPQTRYLWRVGGWTAAAEFLGFSAYAAVETTDAAAPAPFTILIR